MKKEDNNAPSQGRWKQWLSKKWLFPAIYFGAAAMILTFMWMFQSNQQPEVEQAGGEITTETSAPVTTMPLTPFPNSGLGDEIGSGSGPSQPPTTATEQMIWPVEEMAALEAVLPFYNVNAPLEAREAAMLQYENRFIPHVGIDLAHPNQESFVVIAALSGVVTVVQEHPLLGHIVEIDHGNDLVTIYQSLRDVTVSVGDQVDKGDMIAMAGRNELERSLGVHLHFEIRKNDHPQAPDEWLAQ